MFQTQFQTVADRRRRARHNINITSENNINIMSVERNHCPAHIINNTARHLLAVLAAHVTIHDFSDILCQFLSARQQIGSQDQADELLDKIVNMSQALAEAYHILDCWAQFAQCK